MEEHAHSVNEILDKFVADYVPTLSPRTQKDYAYHVRTLRHWFGHRLANDLKARDFRDFMEIRGRGKIQRNRQLAVLSCAFSEAVGRWYFMNQNPCRDVKRHPAKSRTRYVTDTEFNSFKAALPNRIRLAMELALLIGQRQGDILSLRWEKVDQVNGFIRIFQSKTSKRLAIGITPAIAAVLEQCAGMAPTGPNVIRKRDGAAYTSEGFRAIWQRYMRRWVAQGYERFTFHDIRGKCASDCETIERAYELLGHTSIAMTRKVYDRGERQVKALR